MTFGLVAGNYRWDLQRIAEREDEGAWVGRRGLRYYRQVFDLWQGYREGRIGRAELRSRMHSQERRFGRVLRKGLLCPEGKTNKFCANLLRFEESLWTFVRRKGVEPTNNNLPKQIVQASSNGERFLSAAPVRKGSGSLSEFSV